MRSSRWCGRPRHEGWPSGCPVAGGVAHPPATKVMISSSDPGHFGGGGTRIKRGHGKAVPPPSHSIRRFRIQRIALSCSRSADGLWPTMSAFICCSADGLWPLLSAIRFVMTLPWPCLCMHPSSVTGWLGGYPVAYRWVVGYMCCKDIGEG